jgi:hypothetical protein
MFKKIILACLCAPAAALAGDPADAAAPVPPTRYLSPLPPAPAAPPAGTPDQHWKKANEKAAETDSMSLTMDHAMHKHEAPKPVEKSQ